MGHVCQNTTLSSPRNNLDPTVNFPHTSWEAKTQNSIKTQRRATGHSPATRSSCRPSAALHLVLPSTDVASGHEWWPASHRWQIWGKIYFLLRVFKYRTQRFISSHPQGQKSSPSLSRYLLSLDLCFIRSFQHPTQTLFVKPF